MSFLVGGDGFVFCVLFGFVISLFVFDWLLVASFYKLPRFVA